jgi:hypothetical protein
MKTEQAVSAPIAPTAWLLSVVFGLLTSVF